jgi:Flp pilus assembly protein CpaB
MLILFPAFVAAVFLGHEAKPTGFPEGHRAYVVKFDNTPATKLIQPGCRVDVVASETIDGGKLKSSVALKGVLIVVVDSAVTNKKTVKTATLAVKPDDAKTLADAEKKGKLTLVLSPPGGKPKPEKP